MQNRDYQIGFRFDIYFNTHVNIEAKAEKYHFTVLVLFKSLPNNPKKILMALITLSLTTNFRLLQSRGNCRRQFRI